jgi:hypothetical protein
MTVLGLPGGTGAWGGISGNIGEQADLTTALGLRVLATTLNGYFADPSTHGSFSASAWRTDLGFSANGSSLVTAANFAAMRALLDLEAGTDFLGMPTGTPTGSKFLRDDNSWQTVSGLTDGDKTDITVSASGATWTIDLAAVTLPKMANLAQDQTIGRISASTGAPETYTVTAAARTVLDETTVGNMVNVLFGASSGGTGGAARLISPGFTTPDIGAATGTSLTLSGAFSAASATFTTFNVTDLNVSGGLTWGSNSGVPLFASGTPTFVGTSGSGNFARVTSPTFVAPILGVASATNVHITNSTLAYSATPNIDFDGDGFKTITLTGDAAFVGVNYGAGKSVTLRIVGDSSTRNLSFDSDWKFLGAAAPTDIAANKVGLLTLTSFTGADTGVLAAYSVQP